MSRPWLPNEDDERILEQMSDPEIAWTAVTLAIETELGYETIRNRIKFLKRHGFIERPETPDDVSGEGTYQITELGKRYLSGDVTIAELRERQSEESAG